MSFAVAASREYVLVWRTDDCAAYESVYVDKNGVTCSELVIWSADGSRYREVIGGADLTTIRRDWEAASPAFGKVLVPDDAGRKVWIHLDATEDEPVDLIRMGRSVAEEAPVHVPEVEPVAEVVAEPAPEPEMPPVADHVAHAARELAIQVWSTGLIPHPGPHLDQPLAHAASMGWLVVDANRIVRGEVDPRPVTVTRIPNF